MTVKKKISSVKTKKSIYPGLASPGSEHSQCIFLSVHECTTSPIDFVLIAGG